MADLNRVIINGRITKDPEVRMTASGTPLLLFSIANDDFTGNATFFDCKAWRETAEMIGRTFRKGDGLIIDGHLENSTFDARAQGVTYQKTVTYIVADRVFFACGTKSRVAASQPAETENGAPASYKEVIEALSGKKSSAQESFSFEEVQDEDLPF